MTNEDLSGSIVDGIVTLPTIPAVLADLNAIISNPDSSAADVGKIISRDPPTASKVLRLANSAYYGLRNKVTTINHAVTMLGFNIIRNLVLTATVFDFSEKDSVAGLFEVERFWRHSAGTGVAARIVARETFARSERPGEEFFICGLLHDLGKIVFVHNLREKFEAALRLCQEKGVPLYEAEKATIGCTHAEVGALLAKRWSLSPMIVSSVAYHHAPLEASADDARRAAVIHVADILARAKKIGSGGGPDPALDRAAWDVLELSNRKIPEILDDIDKTLMEEELSL
jgi:HD-like signal output (HDOD) protein